MNIKYDSSHYHIIALAYWLNGKEVSLPLLKIYDDQDSLFTIITYDSVILFQEGGISNEEITVLPCLQVNAQDITLNVHFGHLHVHHGPGVRSTNPLASYFAQGLLGDCALLHLARLVWSHGFEAWTGFVDGNLSPKGFLTWVYLWAGLGGGVVCRHYLTHFILLRDGGDGQSWGSPECWQMWPIRCDYDIKNLF